MLLGILLLESLPSIVLLISKLVLLILELDNKIHSVIAFDNQLIPEEERPFPLPKNPHRNKILAQTDLEEEDNMNSLDWYPNNTQSNMYAKKDHHLDKVDDTGQRNYD